MSEKMRKGTPTKPEEKKIKEKQVKISKTWLAFQKNIGTGEIIDMKAVLK